MRQAPLSPYRLFLEEEGTRTIRCYGCPGGILVTMYQQQIREIQEKERELWKAKCLIRELEEELAFWLAMVGR